MVTAALAQPTEWADVLCVTLYLPLLVAESQVLAMFIVAKTQTLLNSGATSHLIMDRSYFWTYDTAKAVTVATANNGTLKTLTRGFCVAQVNYLG